MSVYDLIFPDGTPNKKSKKLVRVLGIDLGTTNSTVAEIVYDPSVKNEISVRCLAVEQPTGNRSHWNPLVPSVVALHDGKEVVGEGARQLRSLGRETGMIEEGNLFAQVKNHMGLRRTYHMAPAGYRSAAEVSGRILAFLNQAAMKDNGKQPVRTTVTVPASFQAAQRDDTLKATALAELTVRGGDLLDEPVAAFIGYLAEHADQRLVEPGDSKHLLVFDFGGGTCDVAVFRLNTDLAGNLMVASLSVSRYNRLGGGDIDQAILYEHLMTQIIEQNGLDRHALDFETKKNILEPAFIGVAEQLKIGLCEKIIQAAENGEEPEDLVETCHRKFVCKLTGGASLTLTNPSLSLKAFDEIMVPFLDPDLLFVREDEYCQALSIFTPIQEALGRCDFKTDQIDLCLLVGGSCLIPHVPNVIGASFEKACILSFDSADAMQTAVARGAALNALSLAIQERPVIQPVCQETIAIVTSNGPFDLIKRGSALPWPPHGGYLELTDLMVPESSLNDPVTIRVEVVAREEAGPHVLLSEMWEIPAPVMAGEKIRMEYRYDENQVLDVRAYHAERADVKPFKEHREHPLTHVSNPQTVKLRIEETEERLRSGVVTAHERVGVVMELAADCVELRQYEKAYAKLAELLRQRNEPNAYVINRMAMYCGYMGDVAKEEKLYVEASAADPTWNGPWFNLALLMKKQNRFDEARHAIDMAIGLDESSAPEYILKAQIVRGMGKDFAVNEFLDMGWGRFAKLASQSDWQLGWYITAADMRDDKAAAAAAREERSRRKAVVGDCWREAVGMLPGLATDSMAA